MMHIAFIPRTPLRRDGLSWRGAASRGLKTPPRSMAGVGSLVTNASRQYFSVH